MSTNRSRSALRHVLGALLALFAGVNQAVIASVPTNDDFVHLVLAQQLRAGDWPVRDFFDGSLMFVPSVFAEWIFGHRLLSEAVLVSLMMGISTYLVFRLVYVLTGSTTAAVLSALLLPLAGIRGYSYPKMIVYAVAATLWWAYVSAPSRARAIAFGAWTAAAFYWRADHGVYVALGVVLAVIAAHGVSRVGVLRLVQAGAVAVALVAPYLIFVSLTLGLGPYVKSGLVMVDSHHNRMNTHAWPEWPIRQTRDIIRVDGAEEYAPEVGLRWTEDSTPKAREAVVARYALTPVSTDGPRAVRVRLSPHAMQSIRALINEPVVEDTDGIERSGASLADSTWPVWDRWRFSHWWLRVRIFPGVAEFTRAAEAVATLFYALPLVCLLTALPWLHRRLRPEVTGPRLMAFSLAGMIVVLGLIRAPYDVRAVDGTLLPSILFGCLVAGLWHAGVAAGGVRRWLYTACAVVVAVLVVKSVAVAGQFGDRVSWLAGDWRSVPRMRGAWNEVQQRLSAQPPLRFWDDRDPPVELRLARYAHDCLPSDKRLLVLWFAPDIYYYADRLMAARHLNFAYGFDKLVEEQRLALTKIERFSPPLVLATGDWQPLVRDMYPDVAKFLEREYSVAAAVEESGQRYVILVPRNAAVRKHYGEQQWPCFG